MLNPKQQQQRWREAWYCLILRSEKWQKGKNVPHKAPKMTEEALSFPQKLSTWLLTPVKESWPQSQHSTSDEWHIQVVAKQDSEKATGTRSGNLVHRKRWLEVKKNERTAYSGHESTALLVPSLPSNATIMGFYFYADSENADDVVRSFLLLYWLVFPYLKFGKDCINTPFTSCTSMSAQCLLLPVWVLNFFGLSLTPA